MIEPRSAPRGPGLRRRLGIALVLVAVAAAGLVALLGRRVVHLEMARLETERVQQTLPEVTPGQVDRVTRALEEHHRRHGGWRGVEEAPGIARLPAEGFRLVLLPPEEPLASSTVARHSPDVPVDRGPRPLAFVSPTAGKLRVEPADDGWRYLETYTPHSTPETAAEPDTEDGLHEEQVLFRVDRPPIPLRDAAGRTLARFHLLPPLPGDGAAERATEVALTSPGQRFRLGVDQGLAWAFALAVLLALAAAFLLARSLVRPLERLTTGAQRMAAGDLTARVEPPRRQDEIHRLALAFNVMAASLERMEASRRRLVADVAHELRTPLTHLQGRLEALQDGLLQPDDELLAALHGDTLVLSRLLDDLQDLAQLEAGAMELDLQEVDLAEVAHKAAAGLPADGPRLRLSLDDAPAVMADPLRLEQILRNLLSNAHRHTPADGWIRLTARDYEPGWLEVRVEDSGEGIPTADLTRIFERFYRADPARRRDTGGSGLGLAIVRQLVAAHGGAVTAESPIDADPQGPADRPGTRIRFTLPKRTPKW